MRRVHETHDLPIGQQPNGHAAMAEQPIELGAGRIVPATRDRLGLVQIQTSGQIPDQQLIRVRRRAGAAQRQRRLERLLAFGDVQRERLGQRFSCVEQRRAETEQLLEEGREVGNGVALGARLALARRWAQAEQGLLHLWRLALHALRVDEHRDGHHEPVDGLHHPEPHLVEVTIDVAHPRVSGQRNTSPTGSRRRRLT